MAQLCSQALGSLFVAFYGSQGYGGGIRTRLHAGRLPNPIWFSLYSLGTDLIQDTVS
jgi:hypothetical protein